MTHVMHLEIAHVLPFPFRHSGAFGLSRRALAAIDLGTQMSNIDQP